MARKLMYVYPKLQGIEPQNFPVVDQFGPDEPIDDQVVWIFYEGDNIAPVPMSSDGYFEEMCEQTKHGLIRYYDKIATEE